VLLWEIGSFGQTPWGVFGVQEMAAAINRGERLESGPAVPVGLKATMLGCWHELPRKRLAVPQRRRRGLAAAG